MDQVPTHSDQEKLTRSVDDYFAVLKPILEGIAHTFGRGCEVVLHDFRDPEHSIVAIAGEVTQRHVGGSVTQIGMSLLAQGSNAENQFNYITRAPNGRALKSSTVLLRDIDGQVFGAFCINFDITDFRRMSEVITDLTGPNEATPTPVTFVDDIDQVIQAVVSEEEAMYGRTVERMNKQDRLAIFRSLDRRGVFALQRSVPHVAECLGISRATAYAYIDEIRAERNRDDDRH